MEKDILNELKEIKKLLMYQLLATGVSPKGVANLVGVKEKRIRDQFLIKEIKGIKNGN